jgi:hypothetical protein
MLQVLPEVVWPEKLLRVVALPELVHLLQVRSSYLPVLISYFYHLVATRGG